MKCLNCSKTVPDNDKYCAYCGASLQPPVVNFDQISSLLGFADDGMAKMSVFVQALATWALVWHFGLSWAFRDFVPDLTEMYLLCSAGSGWYESHLPVLTLWNLLIGATVVWIYVGAYVGNDRQYFDDLLGIGSLLVPASLVAILNIWFITLAYMGMYCGGDPVTGFIAALFTVILAHMLLVGFFLSIGTALFGVAMAILWLLSFALLRCVFWGGLRFARRFAY